MTLNVILDLEHVELRFAQCHPLPELPSRLSLRLGRWDTVWWRARRI
jgi:hypothetical protein